MKLVATTLCIAALSLTGCATDDETNGGGFLEGLRPAKPSPQLPEDKEPLEPQIEESMYPVGPGLKILEDFWTNDVLVETIKPFDGLPAEFTCDGCEVTLFRAPPSNSEVGKITVVSDGAHLRCTIYISDDGTFSNCRK